MHLAKSVSPSIGSDHDHETAKENVLLLVAFSPQGHIGLTETGSPA